MYCGNIKSDCILLTCIISRNREYIVEYDSKKTKKQNSINLSEIINVLRQLHNYEITEWFQGMITPIGEVGDELLKLIKSDIKKGKCIISKTK